MGLTRFVLECSVCKRGRTRPGTATVTLERGDMVIVIQGVPADVCENCGEYFLSDRIAEDVLNRGEAATRSGEVVQVLRYAA